MLILPPSTLAVLASPAPAHRAKALALKIVYKTVNLGVGAIAIDPNLPIEAKVGESFIIAVRAESDAGYGWSVQPGLEKDGVVAFQKTISIGDLAFTNLDAKPGDAHMVGGASTTYLIFRVVKPGANVSIVLGERGPGNPTPLPPAKTETFTVNAQAAS